MFLVFNRDRIISYLVSLSTIAVLFVMSFAITNSNSKILETSANVLKNNEINETKNENITNILQK